MSNPNYTNLNTGSSASAMASVMSVWNTAKEKWDSSGANEAMARASASLPDSTRTYVGSLFNREHLRSVSVYFGIGEERPFYFEKNPSLLMERLRHNMTFFYLNYMMLMAVLFCLTLFVSPKTIIGLAMIGGAWFWLIRASADGTLRVGALAIPQKTATIIMSVLSILMLMWLLSGIFWLTLFWSGFFIAIHAILRDASMHKDMDDVVKMEGDLTLGEDSNFLNLPIAQVVHQV